MLKPPVELSEEFKNVLQELENGTEHLFVTGKAGTGKSTLLRMFKKTTKKKVVVLAPTGIAALNAGGQTIHSFFGFPPKLLSKKDITKRKNHYMYKRIEMIVIDEISMVRADMLDSIDAFLRINGSSAFKPFGGIRMVFFGDMFQLPPVIRREEAAWLRELNYESPYFFSAHIMYQIDLEKIELFEVYRQSDGLFLRLLNNVRLNEADYDDLETLNERYNPDFDPPEFYIHLTTRNDIVRKTNLARLAEIQNKEYTFAAEVHGRFSERTHPVEPILKLKEGAQVMFVKNDPEKRFVNGTIGKVVCLDHNLIEVVVPKDDGSTELITVEPMIWEMMRYTINNERQLESEVVGTFEQFPVRLAWAITIHKSQGQTFDNAIIDLGGGAFDHGQTYVALSRCRKLDGIILKKQLRMRDIMTDPTIVEYYNDNF